MARIAANIAEHVGDTPMVQLTRIAPELEVELYAKLESLNPGGSVKDRIGVAMIEAAEREGRIQPGRTTIVEATSGNTGIALALVCAAKGYELVLTMPQGMSREREGLLRLYGARVKVTESMGGMNEAVAAAQAMANGGEVFLPDQFSNPANPEIHRRATGPEILRAMDDRVDVFVSGVGTGGTITGAGEAIRARCPSCRIVAVEPRSSPVLSGGAPGPHKIQGIGAGFIPEILDTALLDEIIRDKSLGARAVYGFFPAAADGALPGPATVWSLVAFRLRALWLWFTLFGVFAQALPLLLSTVRPSDAAAIKRESKFELSNGGARIAITVV